MCSHFSLGLTYLLEFVVYFGKKFLVYMNCRSLSTLDGSLFHSRWDVFCSTETPNVNLLNLCLYYDLHFFPFDFHFLSFI